MICCKVAESSAKMRKLVRTISTVLETGSKFIQSRDPGYSLLLMLQFLVSAFHRGCDGDVWGCPLMPKEKVTCLWTINILCSLSMAWPTMCYYISYILSLPPSYLYFKVVPMYEGRHSVHMNLIWWYKPEDGDIDYVLWSRRFQVSVHSYVQYYK